MKSFIPLSFRLTPHALRLTLSLLSLVPLLLCSPAVVNAQWEPDVRLTYNDSVSTASHNNTWCIAANGDRVHIVWADDRNGYPNYEIYYKRSTDGGTSWGPDTRLTLAPDYSFYPSVAVSDSNVHVVWNDMRDSGPYEIYYKRSSDAGTSWGADVRLTNSPNTSWIPSLAVSGSNVHVTWEDYRDGNPEIYYKRSTDNGTSWGADARLTFDTAYSWSPSLAVSGSSIFVVWEDLREGYFKIYYKRSTDGGTSWGGDTRLTTDTIYSDSPSIGVSGTNVHVTWNDYRDGNPEIYYKRSTDGGAFWGADTRLTFDTASSWSPSLAASGPNVHVVWRDYRDGGNGEIYYKHSTDEGTTWGADSRLTNNPDTSWYVSVSASGSNVHVVWQDSRDGNDEIYYKRNPTGNVGVEESSGSFYPLTSNLSFSVVPNPFTSFATLPGHEAERFALYDISGRRVGYYRGDRVGEGLAAGVYFLKPEGKDFKPLRIIKLR